MLLLTKTQKRTTISALRSSNVRAIEQNYNEPARLWCNEEWVTSACLRCTEPRCMKFIDAEISCGDFPDFSYERNLDVCPVEAIKWNFDKELPEIDNHSCIGCGLCASRCPAGAIYKSGDQMKIAEPTSDYIDIPINHTNLEEHKLFIRELDKIYWCHQFQEENDEIMDRIYHDVSRFDGRSMIPNILVRNLIIALNHKCAISMSIFDAANHIRKDLGLQKRYTGFKFLSSRTLLSKGLEFDCVIIDMTTPLSAKDFYVAMTRAMKKIYIISDSNTFIFRS